MFEFPHRRYNPLTGEWVLVSPARTRRPWLGAREAIPRGALPRYDPGCYLCPGNVRAGGARNPAYTGTYVFDNDFPALTPGTPSGVLLDHPLLQATGQPGICRVLCFSPRHDLSLAEMSIEEIRGVVEMWVAQIDELSRRYRWVQVFENRGEAMGASNPHPHGQVWAHDLLPNEAVKEDRQQRLYHQERGVPLLVDYAALEAERRERLIAENADWLVVVPFWAVWPFETLLLPRRHLPRLPDATAQERSGLAQILRRLLTLYDTLFNVPFPYSMGWHGAPGGDNPGHWQVHAHFYPPLLRSATERKFLVGYEMLSEAQRDLTPEEAAERLRALPSEQDEDQAGGTR
ncbi:MAG: UDP-glucose--hexose-1-phosphate uridylyltransferase [Armatimonadota bacterium]|nr:UDP-glucose--hexose-1-phosphate uridylyltransferase [Armatimonadota bacterium]MDR7558648.1 UDP-glucose--hexose-1-phosphate uridylyltransferase [Armatimonadota bacterium]